MGRGEQNTPGPLVQATKLCLLFRHLALGPVFPLEADMDGTLLFTLSCNLLCLVAVRVAVVGIVARRATSEAPMADTCMVGRRQPLFFGNRSHQTEPATDCVWEFLS